MGKMITYFFILSFTMILFHLGGLFTDTTSVNNILFKTLLDPSNFQVLNNFQIIVISLQGIAAAASVIIGFLSKDIQSGVMVPIALFFGNLFWDMLIVFDKIKGFNEPLAFIFLVPMMFVFGIVVVDFWRGRD